MAKGGNGRIIITLECTSCTQDSVEKKSTGISRYTTQKNRRNTSDPLELKKFCPYCYKHTIHGEIKK
uniref:Large ribosomal subunit protein bL33c n=2 Tax=Cupressaceae TaxID=3367 RepID=A0A6J4AFV6_9CONI|nr:ribosomal protein L33 [Diselma archeri]QYB21473.1 ribosomal protein L33 [Fitzroya cupressoides]BBN66540.1 ribosomal protein L33 [Diselma archeri]BBN66622.1 ribosomal protein L33 [Fitzroya cupressoides]